jgi:hypothetical protein
MPSPELIDERFDDLVRELRQLPDAPERLHERVRRIGDLQQPESRKRWAWLSARNTGWTLATAVAGIAAVSIAYGVVTSGTDGGSDELAAVATTAEAEGPAGGRDAPTARAQSPMPSVAAPPPAVSADGAERSAAPPSAPVAGAALSAQDRDAVTLPPGRRLARYAATMRLRVEDVDDLSRATQDAMGIARSLGGFVASVRYATPQGDEGDASMTLRVPTSKIQVAIVRLSNLGTIVSQRITISDVQDRVNAQTDEIGRLRRAITRIERRLDGRLTAEERFRLELQLEQARQSLRTLTGRRQQTVRGARLATVTVALTTREREEQPAAPGRIQRAAENALFLLSNTAAGAVWFLIVASPLILLGAVALAGTRARRRRFEQRLLEQT